MNATQRQRQGAAAAPKKFTAAYRRGIDALRAFRQTYGEQMFAGKFSFRYDTALDGNGEDDLFAQIAITPEQVAGLHQWVAAYSREERRAEFSPELAGQWPFLKELLDTLEGWR